MADPCRRALPAYPSRPNCSNRRGNRSPFGPFRHEAGAINLEPSSSRIPSLNTGPSIRSRISPQGSIWQTVDISMMS